MNTVEICNVVAIEELIEYLRISRQEVVIEDGKVTYVSEMPLS